MKKINFHDQQIQNQIAWRIDNISSKEHGYQNKRYYEHIIPKNLWKETLWQGIRKELPEYLEQKNVKAHTGTHNMLSSWIVSANLYFIIRIDASFQQLMLKFLQETIASSIIAITDTELEFAFDGTLSPNNLLGESGGNRGSGQTSPDVAFIVETANGKGIVLTECKFTEHSFYRCSARVKKDSNTRKGNPDPLRCMVAAIDYNSPQVCHQLKWGRKYWDNINFSNQGKSVLNRCPAATCGYQLFRQQSLAEGIAKSNKYELVVTSVAYDGRNQPLIKCLRTTGIPDFSIGWGELFTGKAIFKTWTHQEWVKYVRQNGKGKLQKDWVNYMNNRYGY